MEEEKENKIRGVDDERRRRGGGDGETKKRRDEVKNEMTE